MKKVSQSALIDAEVACVSLLPQDDPVYRQVQIERMRRWVVCMRAHGVNLPDPSPQGSSVGVVFPAGQENSPEYQAAAQACVALDPLLPPVGSS
jgi:hypothetical protein